MPLKEVAGKLKVVPADAEIILQAKEMGICLEIKNMKKKTKYI